MILHLRTRWLQNAFKLEVSRITSSLQARSICLRLLSKATDVYSSLNLLRTLTVLCKRAAFLIPAQVSGRFMPPP